jgi:hypothetical protein
LTGRLHRCGSKMQMCIFKFRAESRNCLGNIDLENPVSKDL